MADEVVRGVVSLSVEGLGAVKQAADALDSFAALSAKAARVQGQSIEQMAKALGLLSAQSQGLDRLAVASERVAAAQRSLGKPIEGMSAQGIRQQEQALATLQSRLTGISKEATGLDRTAVALEKIGLASGSKSYGAGRTEREAALQREAQAQAAAQASLRSNLALQLQNLSVTREILASEERYVRLLKEGAVVRYGTMSNAGQQNSGGSRYAPQITELANGEKVAYNPSSVYGGYGGGRGGGGGYYFGGTGSEDPYGGGAYNRIQSTAGDFQRGFRGLRDRPYAEQLGQTFKFATFYGGAYAILFQLSQAFTNAAQEAIKFQDALNELNIVTGKNTTENLALADSLGQIAARTGASPSEGVAAGARAIGLFGLTTSDSATQAAAARAATTTAAQINLGSGRSFDQIQADIGAIAQAYNTGYQGQSRIADLDAYITRRFGVTVGNSLETTAQVGTLASAQGFSLADQTAIAAALQARTGQSPAAIAGFLSQIYGKGSDSALQAQLQTVGVSPNKDLKTQLGELTRLRAEGKVSDDQLNAIADKVSKGKAGNAFRALIDDYDRIIKAANDADQNAQGAAAKQAATRLGNTAGQLQQLQGAIAEFGKDFLSSGVIEGFGLLAVSFGHLLNALDPLLQAFNSLPDPIRYVTLALIAMQIAAKSFGGYNAVLARIATSGPTKLIENAANGGYAVAQNRFSRELQFIPTEQSVQKAGYETGGFVRSGKETLPVVRGKVYAVDPQTGRTVYKNLSEDPLQTYRRPSVDEQMRNGGVKAYPTSVINTSRIVEPQTLGASEALVGKGARFGAFGLAAAATGAELMATLVNPVTVAIAGLVAIGAIKGKMDELGQAVADAAPALDTLKTAKTSEDYKNAANAIGASAKAVSEGRSGIDGFFAGQFTNEFPSVAKKKQEDAARAAQTNLSPLEKLLYGQAAYATAAGKALATQEAQAAALRNVTIFGDPATRTIENITQALAALTSSGASAKERLDLLYQAITPQQVRANKQLDVPSATVSTQLAEYIGKQNFDFQQVPNLLYPGGTPGKGGGQFAPIPGGNPFDPNAAKAPTTVRSDARAALLASQQENILAAVQKSLPKTAKGGILSPEEVDAVAKSVGESLGVDVTSIDGARKEIEDGVRKYLTGRNVSSIPTGQKLSATELYDQVINAVKPQFEATIAELSSLNDPRLIAPAFERLLTTARGLLANTDTSTGTVTAVIQFIQEQEIKAAENAVSEMESIRKSRQARAKSKKQIAAIGQEYFTKEGKVLAASGDVTGLIDLMDRANVSAIKAFIADLQAAQRLKAKALADARRLARLAAIESAAVGSASEDARDRRANGVTAGESAAAAQQKAYDAASKAVDAAIAAAKRSTAPAKGGDIFTGADSGNPLAGGKGSAAAKDTAAQIAAASQAALAIRSGGGIAAATAQVNVAAADLAVAKKNTVAYYQALGNYFQAQQGLKDALVAYQNNQALLKIDQTDPVAVANEKLKEAKAKLLADTRAKKDKDVIAQDRLDVRSAQVDAESAAFNQRLSDAQTAERLGRTSHAAYIQYLENEHKRLGAIAHRTRQQQDELNQIDGLLKDAQNAAQGQFNLGSIKLPSPYEVRRYIATTAAAAVASSIHSGSMDGGSTGAPTARTNIYINGADVAMVTSVIASYIGSSATLTTGTSTPKV